MRTKLTRTLLILLFSTAVLRADVRYAWADFPACSLYNKEGLPAFPFRSNQWK